MSMYGSSGDVRMILNQGLPNTHTNYMGEDQLPGSLITYALTEVSNEIDVRLKPFYQDKIPFTTVPVIIDSITNKLTVCNIMNSMSLDSQKDRNKEKLSFYCDAPNNLLNEIAMGEVEIPEISSIIEPVSYNNENYNPIFGLDDIENQRIDSDLLDDLAGDKK